MAVTPIPDSDSILIAIGNACIAAEERPRVSFAAVQKCIRGVADIPLEDSLLEGLRGLHRDELIVLDVPREWITITDSGILRFWSLTKS